MQLTDVTPAQQDTLAGKGELVENVKCMIGSPSQLPMLPEAAVRAMMVAQNPDSALGDLAAVIETDVALATGVLRLANSPLYRIGRTLSSLEQAVLRLGMRECQNLLLAAGMRNLFRNGISTRKQQCERLWQHFFVTACTCRRLNQVLDLGFKGEEFACGLSHDLGRILLLTAVPSAFDAADPLDFREGPHTLAREQQVLGTDHCRLGAWFAMANQLPRAMVTTIQYHHNPEQAVDNRLLVQLVALADQLANPLQAIPRSPADDITTSAGWLLFTSDWPEEGKRNFAAAVPDIMAEVAEEAQKVLAISAV